MSSLQGIPAIISCMRRDKKRMIVTRRVTMIPWKRNAQGKGYIQEGITAAENLLPYLRDTLSIEGILRALVENQRKDLNLYPSSVREVKD